MDNKTMVEEIMEVASDVLNDWKIEFMESIRIRIDAGMKSLSDNQQSKLDEIYEKVCNSSY